MIRANLILTAALLLGGANNFVLASPISGSSTGLLSPGHTINFNEVSISIGAPVTTQFNALGATFNDWTYNNRNKGSISSSVIVHNDGNLTAEIFFDSLVTAADFQMQTNPGTSTFEALLGGVPVETFSAFTTYPSSADWFGFQGIIFDEIIITPGGFMSQAVLGTLQFNSSPVPEPTSLALFGLSTLAGAVYCGWRRRKQPAQA